MIREEDLKNLEKLKNEKINLNDRINKLKSKSRKKIADGVKGSSKYFPYTQHICKIERIR